MVNRQCQIHSELRHLSAIADSHEITINFIGVLHPVDILCTLINELDEIFPE